MTPSHPARRIPLLKKGDTRIGSARFWNQIIKTINAIRSLRVTKGSKTNFVLSDDNAILEVEGFPSDLEDGNGWHWASPKEYQFEVPYTIDQVVIVSPGNDAEAEGATFGTWVCVRQCDGSVGAQVPTWPLPDSDPDGTTNYWMLVNFYPTVMIYCMDGEDTPFYVNAQQVPE